MLAGIGMPCVPVVRKNLNMIIAQNPHYMKWLSEQLQQPGPQAVASSSTQLDIQA